MKTVAITGSNRGIGLGLVKEYLDRGDYHVFATCRNPQSATDLQDLQQQHPDTLTIVPLDVNDTASIEAARAAIAEKTSSLDILFNNAGIYPKSPDHVSFGQLERDALAHTLTTNSISPVIVTQAFVDLLKASDNARVVMVSSHMGSIERAGTNGFSYRISKAAVNMAAKMLSQMLASDGIIVITTHPGHVATDMGGASAPVTPVQSAAGLATVVSNLSSDQTGKFYSYDGSELPW